MALGSVLRQHQKSLSVADKLPVARFLKDADIGQIAVIVRVVQSVAHHEIIGNLEAVIVHMEAVGLVHIFIQHGHGGNGGGIAGFKELHQIFQCKTGVDDVLHQNHMAVPHVDVGVLDQMNGAGSFRAFD